MRELRRDPSQAMRFDNPHKFVYQRNASRTIVLLAFDKKRRHRRRQRHPQEAPPTHIIVASNKAFSDFQVRYADRGRRTAVAEWYKTLVAARYYFFKILGGQTFCGDFPFRSADEDLLSANFCMIPIPDQDHGCLQDLC